MSAAGGRSSAHRDLRAGREVSGFADSRSLPRRRSAADGAEGEKRDGREEDDQRDRDRGVRKERIGEGAGTPRGSRRSGPRTRPRRRKSPSIREASPAGSQSRLLLRSCPTSVMAPQPSDRAVSSLGRERGAPQPVAGQGSRSFGGIAVRRWGQIGASRFGRMSRASGVVSRKGYRRNRSVTLTLFALGARLRWNCLARGGAPTRMALNVSGGAVSLAAGDHRRIVQCAAWLRRIWRRLRSCRLRCRSPRGGGAGGGVQGRELGRGAALTDDETGAFTHCTVFAKYPNATLYVSAQADGGWALSVTGRSWSLTPGAHYRVAFQVDDHTPISGEADAVGATQIGMPIPAAIPSSTCFAAAAG